METAISAGVSAPRSRPLIRSSTEPRADRWRRRERVYWTLTALSVVCPLLGIYWVNFDPAINAFMQQMYPGRVASMSTLLNVTVLALWLVVYLHVFLGALKPHRTGDRELVTDLGILLEAAASGMGLALCPQRVAAGWVAQGQLVQPLTLSAPAPSNYHLLVSRDQAQRPAVAAFTDWLGSCDSLAILRRKPSFDSAAFEQVRQAYRLQPG